MGEGRRAEVMPPLWRRLVCRLLGHDWVVEVHGSPVLKDFVVCMRCRKGVRLDR